MSLKFHRIDKISHVYRPLHRSLGKLRLRYDSHIQGPLQAAVLRKEANSATLPNWRHLAAVSPHQPNWHDFGAVFPHRPQSEVAGVSTGSATEFVISPFFSFFSSSLITRLIVPLNYIQQKSSHFLRQLNCLAYNFVMNSSTCP
jgi:hypothetical protein